MGAFDHLIPAKGAATPEKRRGAFDDLIPAPKVSLDAMREFARPGYGKAREKLKARDQLTRDTNAKFGAPGAMTQASSDWQAQVARKTGAFDEVAGGFNFMTQGVENIGRRILGKPIEIPAATAGKVAMDYEREQQAAYAQDHPTADKYATGMAILASARPTGVGMMTNPAAAGGAAALQNAPFAITRQEGTFRERLPGALREEVITFGTGAALTAGANALANRSARVGARPPSDARALSQAGVDLTPGQMMGGAGQRVEDALTSIPVAGDAIRSARVRGIETFDRVAINRALAPIGQELPAGVNVGRDAVGHASDVISQRYQQVLGPLQVAPDQQFAQEIAAITGRQNLPPAVAADLNDIVNNSVASRFNGPVNGETWKAIDSEIGAMTRAADNASANQPTQRYLRDALGDIRTALFGVLERTDPAAAAAVRQADEATANLVRIRQASQYVGTSARGGTFSPADLNRAVQATDTSAGNRAFGRGDALMQDLTEPAMRVLPQTVPDSGTPLRGLVTLGIGAAAGQGIGMTGGQVLGAATAVGAGAAVYSRPVQAAINAVYRAATPGQAEAALSTLAALAARDPQLAPVYDQAVQRLGDLLPRGGGQQYAPPRQPVSMTR